MILLEMKCPQLSKPEATAARNQNSIGDRMEKKPCEKPGSVGGPVPLWPDKPAVCSNCSIRRGRSVWQDPYRSSPGVLGCGGACCWAPLDQCNFSPSLVYKDFKLPIRKTPKEKLGFLNTSVRLCFTLLELQSQTTMCIDSTAPPHCHPEYKS